MDNDELIERLDFVATHMLASPSATGRSVSALVMVALGVGMRLGEIGFISSSAELRTATDGTENEVKADWDRIHDLAAQSHVEGSK